MWEEEWVIVNVVQGMIYYLWAENKFSTTIGMFWGVLSDSFKCIAVNSNSYNDV